MARNWGPICLAAEIVRARTPFYWAHERGRITGPKLLFGPEFKPPRRKVLRQARAERGPRMFEAEEIRRLLKWPASRSEP
jgi:hypothetical protein